MGSSDQRLVDKHGRVFDYLRLAINERCNLRCIYCMAEDKVFPPNESMLQPPEVRRIVDIVARLGVHKIRFTGGEPLLHPQIVSYVAYAKQAAIPHVHLTTHGVLLASKIDDLVAAGLSGVNISIDSLDEHTFRKITRRGFFDKVIAGIEGALKHDIVLKLNVVAMRNINDHEIDSFVEWTIKHNITVRFIELMPFDDKQIWKTGRFVQGKRLYTEFLRLYPSMQLCSGSQTEHHVLKLPHALGKIAIIPSYSRDICGRCNRFRITADGKIRNCLYAQSECDLLQLLRDGHSDAQIIDAIRQNISEKYKDGWHAQQAEPAKGSRTSMSQIGG